MNGPMPGGQQLLPLSSRHPGLEPGEPTPAQELIGSSPDPYPHPG
jgi:hypothetical protein